MTFRPYGRLPHLHPLVTQLFEVMNEQHCTLDQLAKRSGLNRNTVADWRKASCPNITNLVAAYNALGHDLVVKEIKE